MLEFPALALLVKMAAAAGLVVFASLVAEKTGPFMAAMVATLPISAGPAFLFLALEHDDHFIAATALGSMATNIVNGIFSLLYAALAWRFRLSIALPGALAAWLVAVALMRGHDPGFLELVAGTVIACAVLIPLGRLFAGAPLPRSPVRTWYAVPLRALAVAALVALLVSVSARIGPFLSGLLAVFPIVLSSLIVILQPRIGGPATAALIANGLPGLLGFGTALACIHLASEPLGRFAALVLALAVSLTWNGVLVLLRRRRLRSAALRSP